MTKIPRRTLIGATPALLAAPSLAQERFPNRPITMMVGFSAGGSADVAMRALCEPAGRILGQNIVVENRTGGNTTIAIAAVARARPDGYTLGQMTFSAIRLSFMQRLTYDVRRDFTPVTQVAGLLIGVLVRADSPIRDWRGLIDAARRQPSAVTIGNAGAFGTPHLTLEDIAGRERVQLEHVSFRGEAEMLQALLGGHIVAAAAGAVGGRMVTEGRLRWLNVWTAERTPRWPDTPTLVELGYQDLVVIAPWGIVGPAGLPSPIQQQLHAAFREAMTDPGYLQTLAGQDLPPAYAGIEEYGRILMALADHEEALVNRLGLRQN